MKCLKIRDHPDDCYKFLMRVLCCQYYIYIWKYVNRLMINCSIIISHILYCICRYFCITLHLLCYFIIHILFYCIEQKRWREKKKKCSHSYFFVLFRFINDTILHQCIAICHNAQRKQSSNVIEWMFEGRDPNKIRSVFKTNSCQKSFVKHLIR